MRVTMCLVALLRNAHGTPTCARSKPPNWGQEAASVGCDALSMDRIAAWELAQMEYSWALRDADLLRNYAKGTFSVTSVPRRPTSGCIHFLVHESFPAGQDYMAGGASFFARLHEVDNSVAGLNHLSASMCSVANYLNGSYTVACSRPPPGTCKRFTLDLAWHHFDAFANRNSGGGSIGAAVGLSSGGARGSHVIVDTVTQGKCQGENSFGHPACLEINSGKPNLYGETVCEPETSALPVWAPESAPSYGFGKWVTNEEARRELGNASLVDAPLAEWQDIWVWRDGCSGELQHPTKSSSDAHRDCVGSALLDAANDLSTQYFDTKIDFIHLMGDSHLNNMAWCISDEILHLALKGRSTRASEFVRKATGMLLTEHNPRYKNKTLYEYISKCQARPKDCLAPLVGKIMNCLSTDPEDTNLNSELRFCLSKITTLGQAASMLLLTKLNLPPEVTLTERFVVVIMVGHWDSAAQRDVREMVLGELPVFLDAVREIRSDPRTRGMRILLDFGPAHSPGSHSSGWRNSHALAAASAYLRRTLTPKTTSSDARIGEKFININTVVAKAKAALKFKAPTAAPAMTWNYEIPSDAGNLGIEMFSTPSLAVTMSRMLDTADGLHYMKYVCSIYVDSL